MAITAARDIRRFCQPSVIPGFGLSLGVTLTWFSLIIAVPLLGLAIRSAGLGPLGFWQAASDPRVIGALRVSFVTAIFAALVNVVFGTLIAWVLVQISLLLLSQPVDQLAKLYDSQFEVTGLGFVGSLLMILVSILLGLLGAWLAVGRHLKEVEPR